MICYNNISALDNLIGPNEKVFLVTGKTSYELIKNKLNLKNYTRFCDFSPNPKIEDIKKGIELYKKDNPSVVIAIGGGSVIDTAKAINTLAHQEGNPEDYVKGLKKPNKSSTKLIAIPTTAGSGSEATHFAVVYVGGKKYSLATDCMLPDYAIVDYSLSSTMPPYLTAVSGFDALAQAIESYWSVNATDESKEYAKEAMTLIYNNIYTAVHNPSLQNREAMAKGAHLAGKAINISMTTAPHAISYILTSEYNLPHGNAVGITLGKILEFNYPACDDKIIEICSLLKASNPSDASNKLYTLMSDIGLQTSIPNLNIDKILDNINIERLSNNPRKITSDAMRIILNSIN